MERQLCIEFYAVSLLEDNQEASYSDTYTKEEQEEYIKKSQRREYV